MVMVATRIRRVYARVGRGRLGAGAATLLAAACACALLSAFPSPPAPLRTEAHFPHVAPRTLAHALADFTNHPRLYPHLGKWTVEAESGNYSAWRYEVSYACGARCAGRARVTALDVVGGGDTGAGVNLHTVNVAHRACTRLAWLPWPYFCDEWETMTSVQSDGADGAVLSEAARGACGGGVLWIVRRLLTAFSPAPAPAPACTHALRDARDQHLRRLRLLLHTL